MAIQISNSTEQDALISGLRGNADPAVVVYFASTCHSLAALSASIKAAFPRAASIGCTTAGEISSGRMTTCSMVAMALPPEFVSAATAVVEDLKSPLAVSAALESLSAQMGGPLSGLDRDTHVGLIVADGLSGAEEAVMERIRDLTDIPFVGGSAGDDLAFHATLVAANGRTYEHAAVLALLRVPAGYRIIKTQSFRLLGKTLTATEVDEAARIVRRFNDVPAVEAYAQALRIDSASVSACFMNNPVGLMVGGELFVRSPQRVLVDGSIVFYSRIREGAELELLESTDILADTRRALEGSQRALIVFNCIWRTLQLQEEGQCEAFGALFANTPSVGFSTYGEAYMGHVNQTATMLALR
ncbi:MAG: FIST N-terminal domain-containing protein [Terriglobales bacterium]